MLFKVALILFSLSLVSAIPAKSSNYANHLQRRQPTWDASCNRKIPSDPKGRTYRDKAGQAFADASTVANKIAGSLKDGSKFSASTAFSHYFDSDDFGLVESMLEAIAEDNDPSDDTSVGYSYLVKCGSDQAPECGPMSLALTNPRPGNAGQMVLCDRFFNPNTKETKNDLNSKPSTNKRGGWCQSNEKFDFFEVAGLTILHEMTHLDIVGSKAGLSNRPDGDDNGQFMSHGTVDVYVQGTADDQKKYQGMDPWQAARTLHELWTAYNKDNKQYKPTTPAVENAESYAAAALEYFFMDQCGWTEILP